MRLLNLMVCLAVLASLKAFAVPATSAVPSSLATGFEPPSVVLPSHAARLGPEYFSVRTNAPLDTTVEQIAATAPTDFLPFDEGKTYQLSSSTALWLHFRVQNNASRPENWSVVLSKPFIDRVDFYFQDAQGAWRTQAAGSGVPHPQWPVWGLTPQFQLPDASLPSTSSTATASVLGYQNYYLRIQKWIPLRFAATVQRTDLIAKETQHTFFTVGLMLGLMGFMVVFSSVLYFLYRNTAYAWYAAYVAAALLAGASFSGIGAYVLWPAAASWTVISTMVFVLLGMAAQLGFTKAMFISADSPRYMSAVSTQALGLLLTACALFLAIDIARVRVALFSFGVVGGFAVIGVLVVRALRNERQVAGLYLLSFAPMLVVVMLTQIEQLGIAALPWLPYNAPIYGLFFELPLLLVALHLHAKKGHTQKVQNSTLARTDPLTGFVAPSLYLQTLASMWEAARTKGVDLTVVYVKVLETSADALAIGKQSTDKAITRTVRTLRTVARDNDTVAQVDDQIFVILMPGVSRSEHLAGKLARLVALGMMVDADDPSSTPVKFKIVASSLRSFSSGSQALDAAAKQLLARTDGAQTRVIQFID